MQNKARPEAKFLHIYPWAVRAVEIDDALGLNQNVTQLSLGRIQFMRSLNLSLRATLVDLEAQQSVLGVSRVPLTGENEAQAEMEEYQDSGG